MFTFSHYFKEINNYNKKKIKIFQVCWISDLILNCLFLEKEYSLFPLDGTNRLANQILKKKNCEKVKCINKDDHESNCESLII